MRISDWSSDVCSSDLLWASHYEVGLHARLGYGSWGFVNRLKGTKPIYVHRRRHEQRVSRAACALRPLVTQAPSLSRYRAQADADVERIPGRAGRRLRRP